LVLDKKGLSQYKLHLTLALLDKHKKIAANKVGKSIFGRRRPWPTSIYFTESFIHSFVRRVGRKPQNNKSGNI
jgi:hypothetical protein